jgi:predicted aminopeptidase
MQENREIAADLAIAGVPHRLWSRPDDDPVALADRPAQQLIANRAADQIDFHFIMLPDAPKRLIARFALLTPVVALSGCYYVHLASGQLEMNRRQEPITELVGRDDTDAALRRRLELASQAREFASAALDLPDNGSYRSYADLGRPYATWNLFAAPEFSVRARRWCFPIAGCVIYRGYFDVRRAERAAARQARRGHDVFIGPALAYSTLGHLRDPVLNTMLRQGDAELAALIFHELAHQAAYVPGDSDFNEAFATVVELEGARRWLHRLGRDEQLAALLESRRREAELADLMETSRARLATLYGSAAPIDEKRAGKAAEFASLRAALAARGVESTGQLNNARLAAVATYHRCVPALTDLLGDLDGNLRAFYAAIRALASNDTARTNLCASP